MAEHKTWQGGDPELEVMWKLGVPLQFFSKIGDGWVNASSNALNDSMLLHNYAYRIKPKENQND